MDGMPPCVDLGTLYEKIIAKNPSLAKVISKSPRDHHQPVEHRAVAQFRKLVRANFKPEVEGEIVQSLHTQLSLWLGKQHCRPIGSDYKDAKILIQQRLRTYLECQPGSMPPVNQFGDMIFINTTPIMPYLLLGMTDIDGPGCFSGRLKVARLSNRCLAMVPGTAQFGDIIFRFNRDATTYVLRKIPVTYTELDTTIVNFFIDSKLKVIRESRIWGGATTSLFEYLDTSKVEHYNFISECLAELPSN
jgi:hypothetical protein